MQNESSHSYTPAGGGILRSQRRALLYGISLFVLALIQTTLAHLAPLLGAIPDLCLLFVLGIAMFDGAEYGGGCGIAAGFLESALGGHGMTLLPLLFFIIGYGIGLMAGKALARTFPSYMIFILALCILRAAITLAAIGLEARATGFDLTAITNGTLAPEFVVNLITAVPMYPIMRRIHREATKKK